MKNILVKLVFTTLFVAGVGSVANAQFRQSIYLNGNIPTGSFARSVSSAHTTVPLGYEEIGKDASIGFGLGYRASYRFDVGVGEVAPFAQADFMWNMISSDWRKKYMDAEYTTPTYFNIPLLAGVSYFYDEMWNDITPFAEFGVGTDILKITREGKKSKENNGTLYYAYKSSAAFSWMLGAGAWFGRHVSAGVYYYGMGTHPIDYTKKTLRKNNVAAAQLTSNNALNHGRETRTVGSIMLRIGFHF